MARWFRHYEGMNADPCFGGVARRCTTSRATVVFVFSSLCELEAASAGQGYRLDADAIADLLGEKTELVEAIHTELTRIGKVKKGHVCSFGTRNYISDSSTERSRKHRERSRNADATLRNVPETESETESKTETEKKEKRDALPRFDDFWNACPKKTGKGEAEKAWPRALRLADADTIIAAMRAYAASQAGTDPKFIKTPGPWLNGKHWLDDGIAPKAKADPAQLREQRERAARLGLPTDRIDRAIEEAEARAA